MIKQLNSFVLLVLVVQFSVAQTTNAFDTLGKRHGTWSKTYKNSKQLRYSGTFEHGQEVGIFNFYGTDSGKQPEATKSYTAGSPYVDVTFYTKTGKVTSKGAMLDKQRHGKWLFYGADDTSLVSSESFVKGKLEGMRTVYFDDGQVAETTPFINGEKQGVATTYFSNGKLSSTYTFLNGILEGAAKIYDTDGILIREGNYKDNRKHGTWSYYLNGEVVRTEVFPKYQIGVQN